jgi:hypothetical protein
MTINLVSSLQSKPSRLLRIRGRVASGKIKVLIQVRVKTSPLGIA